MSDAPAIFLREPGHGDASERFVPTEAARGPWSPRALHGGAVCGILARSLERAVPEPELLPVRMTVDLFRPAPTAPLSVDVRAIREGRRLRLLDATLESPDGPVARATALYLLRTEGARNDPFPAASLPPPEGIARSSLSRGAIPPGVMPPGLHTTIDVRWITEPGPRPQAAWLRLPVPLVAGEPNTPFVLAATLADFTNAVGSMSMPRPGVRGPTFINADITLYLSRLPAGEWIGMAADYGIEEHGVGVVEVAQHDVQGRFGRCVQARLAQRPGNS
jgi:hypothetical protein